MKRALITGTTGQDGAYLSELLLAKGYDVHGLKRRASSFNTQRIDHLFQDPHESHVNYTLHYGDMTDSTNLIRLIQEVQPDEIYNLAAQSHVAVSFETPEYTANADGIGTLRLLEAIRILGLEKKTRFYQASYWITVNYREAYGIHASNGILFNHESPLRGETFVTRKITRAAAAIKLGLQDKLYLGNMDAKRDWGHAKDYVEGMWRIVQHETAEDFVLATGETHTVRSFVDKAFAAIDITLDWRGEGVDEKGYNAATGDCLVEVDPRYFRPTEVELLIGDPAKAKEKLGWEATTTLAEMVSEMVTSDLDVVQREANRKDRHG